jgi:probable blue pigment (indigoidine) exporter
MYASVPSVQPLHPALKSGLVAIMALVAGFCYIMILRGLEHAAPWRFASLRVLIAGSTILLIALAFRRPVTPAPARRAWVVPLGLSATALTFGAMFVAPLYTGTGLASVLGNLQPLFVLVLAWVFLGERLTAARAVAISLGVMGVTLIALGSFATALGTAAGIMVALLSSTGAAVGSVLYRFIAPEEDWLALTGWQLLTGGFILLVASVLAGEPAVHWNLRFAGTLAFLTLAETTLVTLVWFWLLRRFEASDLAPNLFFVPIAGLILAVVLQGEQIRLTAWLGSGVILAGIGASVWLDSKGPDSEGKSRSP